MTDPVVIVDYDTKWPFFYGCEAKLIQGVLGGAVKGIEHIGSTAVPNLGAKNIVDIMVGVDGFDEANRCLAPLGSIGYTEVTSEEIVDWYYCLGKSQRQLGFHLHLVRFGSEHWRKHLIFRDFLRMNPQVAQEYFDLKRELAVRHRTDRLAYTEAKAEFIESTVKRAQFSVQT